TGSGKRVLILGAGLAGLAAAYELDRRGYAVTVLEARTRPGGRVLTLREPFSDGLYAEAGAIFIPDDHDVTLKYARQFKLPLVPISRRTAAAMYYLRGQRVLPKAGQSEEWPLDLTAEERQLGRMGMYRKYLIDFLREIVAQADPASPDWPPE